MEHIWLQMADSEHIPFDKSGVALCPVETFYLECDLSLCCACALLLLRQLLSCWCKAVVYLYSFASTAVPTEVPHYTDVDLQLYIDLPQEHAQETVVPELKIPNTTVDTAVVLLVVLLKVKR